MMARSVSWRRSCPDQIHRRIEQAMEARFYILREIGPTGFLVKEDEHEKKFKVLLGDPNSCTCSTFMKEKDLCIHILWILLKKFRIRKENPLVFQKALVEREISEVIQGLHVQKRDAVKTDTIALNEKDILTAKSIDEEDVCPICQEELLDRKEPLTHCKFGCGNNIHIKCMKVWAQHRKSDGDNMIKCPLCRTEFGSYQDIIQEFHKVSSRHRHKIETNDVHIGATCSNCKTSPIQGKCFRCVVCIDIHLCQECFGKQIHMQHSFQFRKNTNQRWRAAARNPNRILPAGIVESLQNRDIGEDDYELLLQLDSRTAATNSPLATLPLSTLNATSPEIKERMECQLCCEVFRISNHVRRLACQHSFHKDCIDEWISRGNLLCPFDRSRISGRKDVVMRSKKSVEKMVSNSHQTLELSVFGVNSTNFLFKKQEQEVKPKKANEMCGIHSLDTCANGTVKTDVNELFIHGGVVRRGCGSEERTQSFSAPATKTGAHLENTVPSQHHRNPKARLPPLHPNRSKPRSHSNHRLNKYECAAEGNNELKIGDFEASSERIQRRKGSLTKKRTSSKAFTSISSSEPDLVSLSDAFRVSRITHLESNGL